MRLSELSGARALGECVISASDKVWVNFWRGRGPTETGDGTAFITSGDCSVIDGVLYLGSWRMRDGLQGHTWAQAEEYLRGLPRWDATELAVIYHDLGAVSVVDVATTKAIDERDLTPEARANILRGSSEFIEGVGSALLLSALEKTTEAECRS